MEKNITTTVKIIKRNIKAFTMIEIIVVIVIVGIFMAFGFPMLFVQMERNRAQEAMNRINIIKSLVETCALRNAGVYTNCGTWSDIGMDDPSNQAAPTPNPGSNFDYTIDTTVANISFIITAVRIPLTTPSNTVVVSKTSAGNLTCVGTGAYVGFCA